MTSTSPGCGTGRGSVSTCSDRPARQRQKEATSKQTTRTHAYIPPSYSVSTRARIVGAASSPAAAAAAIWPVDVFVRLQVSQNFSCFTFRHLSLLLSSQRQAMGRGGQRGKVSCHSRMLGARHCMLPEQSRRRILTAPSIYAFLPFVLPDPPRACVLLITRVALPSLPLILLRVLFSLFVSFFSGQKRRGGGGGGGETGGNGAANGSSTAQAAPAPAGTAASAQPTSPMQSASGAMEQIK